MVISRLKSKAWAFKEFAFPRKVKNERRRGKRHHRPCDTEHGILSSMMFYYCSADLPGSLAIPDRLPYVSLIEIDLLMIFFLICLSLIIGGSTEAKSCTEPCATTWAVLLAYPEVPASPNSPSFHSLLQRIFSSGSFETPQPTSTPRIPVNVTASPSSLPSLNPPALTFET